MNYLIQDGMVVDAETGEALGMAIEGGKIASMEALDAVAMHIKVTGGDVEANNGR